jgi:hypothetical protein
MEQKRSTRLVLKTSDLTNGSTTNIGSCDTLRQNFTWFNINLRALLGDLYNQYDYFNLLLISVSSSHITAAANQGSADDRLVYVKISGLPFINQSYNQPTGNNGIFTTATILSIPINATANTQQFNNVANVMTFNKDQDLCNINISLFRILDDTRPVLNAGNINPQFTFIFTIIGIDQADNQYIKNRLMSIN